MKQTETDRAGLSYFQKKQDSVLVKNGWNYAGYSLYQHNAFPHRYFNLEDAIVADIKIDPSKRPLNLIQLKRMWLVRGLACGVAFGFIFGMLL
jgi:hypothetical protein